MWEQPIDRSTLHRIGRHVRIWRRFLIIAFAREAQFRANAIGTVLVGLCNIVVSLIPVLVLFEFTGDVKGWSRPEVIALAGMFQVVTGLLDTFVSTNMLRATELVTNGELDGVLLRPMSSQFYITFRWVNLSNLFSCLAGLGIMIFGLRRAGASVSLINLVEAGAIAMLGTVMLICFWSALIYLVFWVTAVHSIASLFFDMLWSGGYPTAFFPVGIRVFLTAVFPVAFVSTIPMESVLGRGSIWNLPIAIIAAFLAVMLTRAWWRYALRFYSSASS